MIRLENVHTGFGGKEVLRGLNLRIERGETYVLLGPSGAGAGGTEELVDRHARTIVAGDRIAGGRCPRARRRHVGVHVCKVALGNVVEHYS